MVRGRRGCDIQAGACPAGTVSGTDENITTRGTSRIFAIIAASPPPCECPPTAIRDHFGAPLTRNLDHPCPGCHASRESRSLVNRLSTLVASLTAHPAWASSGIDRKSVV